jgi:hypothetical protein
MAEGLRGGTAHSGCGIEPGAQIPDKLLISGLCNAFGFRPSYLLDGLAKERTAVKLYKEQITYEESIAMRVSIGRDGFRQR